jgi:[protein]-arginine 3-hydroxylase / protease
MQTLPIERIAPPSREEFEERYVRCSRPVILRDAIGDWPAISRWSGEYFRRRFGDREVPVVRVKNGALYDPRTGVNYEKMRVSAYVDRLEQGQGSDLYMVFRVHDVMPELFEDVVRPEYCRDASWSRSRLWFASPDTKGALHRDLPENLYAQITGRKKFLLLNRRMTRLVYRYPLHSGVPNYSPVDAEAPDLHRYPRFADADLISAEVEPGDLLYIPSMWWHQARSLDVSLSINLWWLRGPMVAVARAAELFMGLRKLRL